MPNTETEIEYARNRLCEYAMLHGELNYLISLLRPRDEDYIDKHLPKLALLLTRIKYCNEKIQDTYKDLKDEL